MVDAEAMQTMRRHPVVIAFFVGIALAGLLLSLRMTGPAPLLHVLQWFVDTILVGLGLLIAGWFLARRGLTWIRPLVVFAGLWVGFVGGFYLIGLFTCAFCLA